MRLAAPILHKLSCDSVITGIRFTQPRKCSLPAVATRENPRQFATDKAVENGGEACSGVYLCSVHRSTTRPVVAVRIVHLPIIGAIEGMFPKDAGTLWQLPPSVHPIRRLAGQA